MYYDTCMYYVYNNFSSNAGLKIIRTVDRIFIEKLIFHTLMKENDPIKNTAKFQPASINGYRVI